MSTTLIPLDPTTSVANSARILTISADLLPEEVVAARQARRSRTLALIVAAVVAVGCAAWFGLAVHDKQQADESLTQATEAVTKLQRDQTGYSETLQTQSDIRLLNGQLTSVMGNDLDWAALLATLRAAGSPSGITVTGVNGRVNTAGTTSEVTMLPGSATDTIGSVILSGAGPDKAAVAAYVDALSRQTVVTNAYVTSVASEEGDKVTFSLRVDLTRAALCGRFITPCKTSGGN